MKNKKGIRPMGELIGAMLISIIIVIVAVSLIFAWFGGFISPRENAINSARDLAQAIDTIEASMGAIGIQGVRTCNELDMAVFPDYRLIVDTEKVIPQHKCLADEDDCDEGDIVNIEINEFDLLPDSDSAVCSPFYFDANEHTTHCDWQYNTAFFRMEEFEESEGFTGSDYLIINKDWNNKIVGTYCVCAISSKSLITKELKGGVDFMTLLDDINRVNKDIDELKDSLDTKEEKELKEIVDNMLKFESTKDPKLLSENANDLNEFIMDYSLKIPATSSGDLRQTANTAIDAAKNLAADSETLSVHITQYFAGSGGRTIVYPKGLSATCLKILDKLTEDTRQSMGDKIKEPFITAYERVKNWLKRNFGKQNEVVEEQEGSS